MRLEERREDILTEFSCGRELLQIGQLESRDGCGRVTLMFIYS